MRILSTVLMLMLFMFGNAQNILRINDLQAGPGESTKILVSLDNQDAVSGFQFKLKVPPGLILSEKQTRLLGRQTDHVVYPKNLGNGEYLFLCFSAKGENLTGTTGNLLEIPGELPTNFVPGTILDIFFTENILSNSSGQALAVTPANGKLTVVQGKTPDFAVSNVSSTSIFPGNKATVKWSVSNAGQAAATSGWQEQITLVSQETGKRFILGNTFYNQTIAIGETVNRESEFTVPAVIGFDGNVKVEIKLIPLSGSKEPENLATNNTALSSVNALGKRLSLTIDKSEVIENSSDKIRVNVTRSGDISKREVFTISSSGDAFGSPLQIVLEENQSSQFAYIQPADNSTYEGNKNVDIILRADGYNNENASVKIIDDEKIALNVSLQPGSDLSPGKIVMLTLSANFSQNKDQQIILTTDDAARLKLPANVLLKAGEKSVTFAAEVLATSAPIKATSAHIFAKADGYTSGTASLNLNAAGISDFKVTISPNKVSEGDGAKATFVTIKRTTNVDKETVLKLSASKADNLIFSSDMVFGKGESEKTFTVGTVDNAEVDGSRTITLTAAVLFASCNCTDPSDATTTFSSNVEIVDNDGLALKIVSTPANVKTGSSGKLSVTRNAADATSLQSAVTVVLTSDNAAVKVPASVVIPAGQKSTETTYQTVVDSHTNQDKSVRIQAESAGYATGFTWILLTNQNKADISNVEVTADSEMPAAQKNKITIKFKNTGNAELAAGADIDFYLSKNNSIKDLKPFASAIIKSKIASGESFVFSEEVQFPAVSGTQNIIAVINGRRVLDELDYNNNQGLATLNILPSYSVEILVDKRIYQTGETIKISGAARTTSGVSTASAPVQIKIENNGFVRTFDIQTNASGTFIYEFKPLSNESGNYKVSAAYPGTEVSPQVTFDILGFEITDKPKYIKWEPQVNIPLGKEFKLKNNTSVKLTNVKIELPENAGFSIEQTPATLEPNATGILGFKIISTTPSTENKYAEIPVKITSAEGAMISEVVYYHSRTPEAHLTASPISINTTMVKGQKRQYEVSITNDGMVDAEDVLVRLPALPWLKLASSEKIERIKAGEEVKVVLEFEPTVKEQINVPVVGNFVIQQKQGNALSVPFSVETVSNANGKLSIDAVDEYYYNTAAAPHLKGAKVIVKHPYTGAVVAEGITGDNGIFEVPELKEGWYTINVSAEKHTPYQNNILVDPGKTLAIEAYLPYRAVTYSWDVKPTNVQDKYDITVHTTFETNVPKPVITMEIDNNKLDLQPGESRMTYVTVTNHGLIAATKAKISMEDIQDYKFDILVNYFDKIEAKSSVVIPVLVTNTKQKTGKGISNRSSNDICYQGKISLEANFPCGKTEGTIEAAMHYISLECRSLSWVLPNMEPHIPYFDLKLRPNEIGDPGWFPNPGPLKPLDICDSCTKSTITTFLKCFPLTAAGDSIIRGTLCAIDIITIKSMLDAVYAVENCWNAIKGTARKINCPKDIACTLYVCATGLKNKTPKIGNLPSFNICDYINKKPKEKSSSRSSLLSSRDGAAVPSYQVNMNDYLISSPSKQWDGLYNDFIMFTFAQEARFDKFNAYLNDWNITDNGEKLFVAMKELHPFIDGKEPLSQQDIERINAKFIAEGIPKTYISSFSTRWNNTLDAWAKGIYSPTSEYPNIVDKLELDYYDSVTDKTSQYIMNRGFVSLQDMYTANMNMLAEYVAEKQSEPSSVCATVSLDFPQKMAMTREAFEGTLRINNSSAKTVKDIQLDLIVTDANGENKTSLFQINKDAFISGTGQVAPDTSQSGKAIFIPTKEAAPQVPMSYNFGGVLSYYDEEVRERVYVTLSPVTLQVNPSPDLELHYFMQRNILGDDALTEDKVEPIVPAEMSLLIKNDGYGLAKNVNIESMQPRIVENVKGLAVDFKMIGSNLNNLPKELGLLNINFGDIAAKSTSVGQWWFTSTLMGHFISYDVQVNHASSFGNSKLSLIKSATIHELIKSVKDYRDGKDDVSDFLVNDVIDSKDTPDRIFGSDGNSESVVKAESTEISGNVSSSIMTSKLTLKPSTSGWNYGMTKDPGVGKYEIVRVIRDNDGKELPLNNFWQTHVTLKDGLNPMYENNLHALDYISEVTTYTLHFKPIDGNRPEVVSFDDIPTKNSPVPVEFVKVKFNKEIDVITFGTDDIELMYQGKMLPSDKILIGKISADTYSLGLTDLTKGSGAYQLTVKTAGIKDALGNDGRDGKSVSWIQFINELGILEFKSDQVKKQPVNTITVTFNKAIRSEEFTSDKVLINGQTADNVKIAKIDEYRYAISGIAGYNKTDSNYQITVKLPFITSVDGVKGAVDQSYEWVVNTIVPKVETITPLYQGGTSTQNATQAELKLNQKILFGLEPQAITLFRNGQKVEAALTVEKTSETTYLVKDLGKYTIENGTYTLSVDQSSFKNEDENMGSGKAEVSWQVNSQNLAAIKNLMLTPDRGISATDNITAGEDVALSFETMQPRLTVKVYEMQATQPVLIETIAANNSGQYKLPVAKITGAKKYKLVAQDASGNVSEPMYLNGYIDGTETVISVNAIKTLTDDCSGFDHINVSFSEPVIGFSTNHFKLTAAGIALPMDKLVVRKVNEKQYIIENITSNLNENVEIDIDRTLLVKTQTGLSGKGHQKHNLGMAGGAVATLVGLETATVDQVATYEATTDLGKYDWIAINGEIIASQDNRVTVKWKKAGQQTLILRYKTPLGCAASAVKNVEVKTNDVTLATTETTKRAVSVAPVPNDGNFTVFTQKPMKNATIYIYDASGRLVEQLTNININSKHEVRMKNPVSGIYIMILQNNEEKFQFRYIIK